MFARARIDRLVVMHRDLQHAHEYLGAGLAAGRFQQHLLFPRIERADHRQAGDQPVVGRLLHLTPVAGEALLREIGLQQRRQFLAVEAEAPLADQIVFVGIPIGRYLPVGRVDLFFLLLGL